VYPEEVSWIRTTMKNGNSRLPSEILTEEEIRRMAQVASSPRDRALVLVFYESGARVGELLPLKMKQVAFDDYGAVLLVRGKTGDRRIRLVLSSPALANWINIHPLREDPEANVWLSLSTNNDGHPLGYRGLYKLFQELAAKAQIRKKVNPHSFRHARATHLASKLTEQQLKMLFGWTQSSKMASVYVHLSGKDIDNALLELHGLTTQEKKESKLKVKVCPRCGEKNSPGGIYCRKCAFPIDAETMEWENKAMDELIRTPQVSRYLKRMLREILIKRRR
jgi:integrase